MLPKNEIHVFSVGGESNALELEDIVHAQVSISCLTVLEGEQSEPKLAFFCNDSKQLMVLTSSAIGCLAEPAHLHKPDQVLSIKLPANQLNSATVTDLVQGS